MTFMSRLCSAHATVVPAELDGISRHAGHGDVGVDGARVRRIRASARHVRQLGWRGFDGNQPRGIALRWRGIDEYVACFTSSCSPPTGRPRSRLLSQRRLLLCFVVQRYRWRAVSRRGIAANARSCDFAYPFRTGAGASRTTLATTDRLTPDRGAQRRMSVFAGEPDSLQTRVLIVSSV